VKRLEDLLQDPDPRYKAPTWAAAVTGATLLLYPMRAFGQAAGAGPGEEGCREVVSADRIEVAGDCYFTPLWLEAASVELHGSIWGKLGSSEIHLSSGRVRAFNFSQGQTVRIVAESEQYNVAALPSGITEASFNDEGDVVFFSRRGATTLAVSYEASQRVLNEGEGLVVGLTPPKSNDGSCTVATWAVQGSSSDSKGSKWVRPPGSRGGWVLVVVGMAGLALIWTRKWTGAKSKNSAAE
jgi:hypothetical protein